MIQTGKSLLANLFQKAKTSIASPTPAEVPIKISLEGIHKHFGSKKVLQGVDLAIPEGQSVVVIGGSGTGKSVLLKNILGLQTPDVGRILIDGQDITKLRGNAREAINANIGMLFQGAALFDSLPVWQNVSFGLMQGKKLPRKEAKEVATETLRKVGLSPDVANLMPSELSGGMQKRVGLARAIASKPAILFFDEPTTGLDPIMADVINDLIVQCVKDLGATALSITHDMASVRKIADRVAMLYHGKIIWYDTVSALDTTDNPYVHQFVHGLSQGPIQVST
ncbi:MAG: ABC transporter ATP-binding protein [Holosporales bacterium]|jgi:phospholipid/cholesterol/gamma-HCH transport system ATP-binding protein